MDEHAAAAAEMLARLRVKRPLIHHITNFVVMHSTANITLCVGALPVMAHAAEEVEEMVGAAAVLVLNLGTLWPVQAEAMLLAGHRANQLRPSQAGLQERSGRDGRRKARAWVADCLA